MQAQHQQQPLLLAVDDFERAIELLEKAHFDAVKAWWDEEQAGESPAQCTSLSALQHAPVTRMPSITMMMPVELQSAAGITSAAGNRQACIVDTLGFADAAHVATPDLSVTCPAGPSTSAPRVPTIPAMKTLLPRATALDVLSELVPDRKLAAQLLDYWLKKRAQEGGPLLARLWFEQPWKV